MQSVIQVMLLYSFHIYSWPINLLQSLERGIHNFIWNGDITQKKLVTISWDKLCKPVKVGGFGIGPLNGQHELMLDIVTRED